MRPGSDGDCPVQGLRPRRPSRGGSALLGPAKPKAAWGAARSFFFFFFSFLRLQLLREEPLWRAPSKPRAPWKLASQPPLPTCNLGPTSEAERPPPSLPPCPAARRWPLGLGSGTWESRSRGGEGKGVGVGGAGRLRSWGCLRQQGPGRGGKGGGGPGQQQPRRPAAGAARRSGGCRASPPVPFSLALRWEAGQREARRSLA